LADFVTVEDGTGVVHIAPGFGEDDMSLGREKNLPTILHVTPEGSFTTDIKDWPGELVKPKGDPQMMDKKVVQNLENRGLMFKVEEFSHSYPFCWRCDTPLLNYATSSWFVKVTDIKKDLIKNNKQINWTPKHIKGGRFGKWLENAQDWAISRQRYWGATIPVWKCEDCGEVKVFGSIEEINKASGQKVKDLHKHIVDEIILKCSCGKESKRVPDVLDCWFESGSMPYAQIHYPFENKEWFNDNFPAEFIAEGIDQTRGWFYTLMVLSTALFNKPAFKNVIDNGIVLAKNGQKMSKKLKNYPDPNEIIDQFGADALRFYLLSSPVMEAENLNFSEIGVKEALQKNIMLIGNVLSFYLIYKQNKIKEVTSKNILDRWILAKLNLLNQDVTKQMKGYNLVKATRPVSEFINEFSTWYLRRSRDRFKAGDMDGINTLGYILLELSKIVAPFIPFTAEDIYQQVDGNKKSVHLEDWPEANKKMIDKGLIKEMDLVRQIVEKGLAARAEAGIKVRQALSSYATSLTKDLNEDLVELVKEELNIKALKFGLKDELDTELTEELKQEGLVREITRYAKQLRKENKLTPNDRIILYQIGFNDLVNKYADDIKALSGADKIITEEIDKMKEVEGGKVGIKKIGK
ncbi:class I tRNA ligase family protein, partial [bacterium]|nr:class I tRNA ligase family protein [bacterium]